jgi:hypothetical protein
MTRIRVRAGDAVERKEDWRQTRKMQAGIFYGVTNFGDRVRLFRHVPLKNKSAMRATPSRTSTPSPLSSLGVRRRVIGIKAEVARDRRQREFENRAAIFARAQGKAPSPVPQSGVAIEMAKLLAGQALFDSRAVKILENLGLNPSGRNKSWRGPVYSDAAEFELDGAPKALPGVREKTASPRVRR